MIHTVAFEHKNKTLRGFVHVPKRYKTAVILLHGFPSRCQGFTISRMAKVLEKKHLVFRFDFSGTDMSDGKFENKLISQEVKEIKSAVNFLCNNYEFEKLVLVGHSTGAIDAALYAHKDKRVDKIVLIGGSGDLKEAVKYEFTPLQVRAFWKKGFIKYEREDKWYDGYKLNKAYYDEFFSLDMLKALGKYKRPTLIIHAEKDEFIPLKDAKQLFNSASSPKKLVVIRNANHQFSTKEQLRKLGKVILKFCK